MKQVRPTKPVIVIAKDSKLTETIPANSNDNQIYEFRLAGGVYIDAVDNGSFETILVFKEPTHMNGYYKHPANVTSRWPLTENQAIAVYEEIMKEGYEIVDATKESLEIFEHIELLKLPKDQFKFLNLKVKAADKYEPGVTHVDDVLFLIEQAKKMINAELKHYNGLLNPMRVFNFQIIPFVDTIEMVILLVPDPQPQMMAQMNMAQQVMMQNFLGGMIGGPGSAQQCDHNDGYEMRGSQLCCKSCGKPLE